MIGFGFFGRSIQVFVIVGHRLLVLLVHFEQKLQVAGRLVLVEALEQVLGGDDLVLGGTGVFVDVADLDAHRCLALLKRDLGLVVVLGLEVLQWNVGDGGIVLLVFEGGVGDQG